MAVGDKPHLLQTQLEPPLGSDFYYATFYLDPVTRHQCNVLEACRREVGRIPQTCSDLNVAYAKLAWWHDEFERINHASPRHEISRNLARLTTTSPDVIEIYLALVDQVRASLYEPELDSAAAVMDKIREMYGDIFRQIVICGGTYDLDTVQQLVSLACSIELGYELKDFRKHRRGRLLFIPEESLLRHGLTADHLRQATSSADIRDLLDGELHSVTDALHTATMTLPRALRRQQRLLCTLSHILQRVLQLTLDAGCTILEQDIELTPVHKLWLAWRTRTFG